MLGPLCIFCHSQSYSCNSIVPLFFITHSTPVVFIHSKSHLANMMTILNDEFFFFLGVYLTQNTHPASCHITGHYAIHELLRGHIQWVFLYYRKPSINLIYKTAVIWLCKVSLYGQCSFISSVSPHTSHRTQKMVTTTTVFDCLLQGTSNTEHTRLLIILQATIIFTPSEQGNHARNSMETQLCHHIFTHVTLPMWLFLKHTVFNSMSHTADQYMSSGLFRNCKLYCGISSTHSHTSSHIKYGLLLK